MDPGDYKVNTKSKNKMRNRVYLLLMLTALIIVSCSNMSEQGVKKLPGIDIPVSKMNREITMEADPGMLQVHKNGEILGFLIRNRTANTISFSQNFGVKIFKKQGADWESVEDKMGYPEGENILPTNTTDPTGLAFFVLPDLEDIDESTNVRIVIIGHITNKPTEQVGAYIDILYEP